MCHWIIVTPAATWLPGFGKVWQPGLAMVVAVAGATIVGMHRELSEKVRVLRGLIPTCSQCKRICDDKGYWNQLETFLREHSHAEFSHGICPECAETHYGEYLK